MDRHGRLAVAEGREVLGKRHGNRTVARNDLFNKAAHGLETERKRRDVEQQPVVVARGVACKLVGLHRSADRHDLVGIDVVKRGEAEELLDGRADAGHARRATDEHHAADVGNAGGSVAQNGLDRVDRLPDEVAGHCVEFLAREIKLDLVAVVERKADAGRLVLREGLLRGARERHQTALFGGGEDVAGERVGRLAVNREAGLGIAAAEALRDVTEDAVVEVVAAQRRIAARGENFEDSARELEKRDVERAAAEIVDHVGTLGTIVEAVGERSRRRLVEKAQNREVRKTGGVLRRLALRIVEVGGNRDHGARQIAAETVLGALCKRAEDFGTHLDGRLDACGRGDADHRRIVDEVVRQIVDVGQILHRAADEALGGGNGVLGIAAGVAQCDRADRHCAVGGVVNDGGQDGSAPFIEDHLRGAADDACHQGVRGA